MSAILCAGCKKPALGDARGNAWCAFCGTAEPGIRRCAHCGGNVLAIGGDFACLQCARPAVTLSPARIAELRHEAGPRPRTRRSGEKR